MLCYSVLFYGAVKITHKWENHIVDHPKQDRLFCFVLFCLFSATPVGYGSSQARGLMRATAAGLYHSHSNYVSLRNE